MNKKIYSEKNKIKSLINENEPVANRVISTILLVMAVVYLLVGGLSALNIYRGNQWVAWGLFSFAIMFVVVAGYCLKVNSRAGWIKYVQIIMLLVSLFMINVVIGYKIWMMFVLPLFLTIRFYNRRFTVMVGILSMAFVILSSFTNAYLGPYLGIFDLNLVSFKEPGTISYYSWLFNAVLQQGYDSSRVVANGLKLSAFPNCLAILISILVCNSIISNAEKMLVDISDGFEKEIQLLREAHMDELTGTYNRRAYEKDLSELSKAPIDKDFVYMSIDVNGLKQVNDTLGHVAGDEIIVGAADCLSKVFGDVGKVYRIGGDEFVVIAHADEILRDSLKKVLDSEVDNWKGSLVDKIAISVGCVAKSEADAPDSINEIAIMADKRMYEEKSKYYISHGIDRRASRK